MKKTYVQVVAAGMAAVMAWNVPMANVLAAAPEKEQTVYVNADENGNVEKMIVSSWLKNAGKEKELNDRSELDHILNVKGEESFKKNSDGTMSWLADGNDIYYQGETKKELPVSVKMTYYLNGKKLPASELAGKSGKIKIRIDYENKSVINTKIGGKTGEINTPFMMATGMILPTDKFSNIEVKNGKVISDGKNNIVLGIGFPGLSKSLKLSEAEGLEKLEIPDYVEVTADVKNFELGMTVTAATTGTLKDFGLDHIADTKELEKKLDVLSDSSKALVDGSRELQAGTKQLNTSVDELTAGLAGADAGAGQLKQGIDTMNAKKGELQAGVGSLAQGAGSLKSGAQELNAGSSEFRQQLRTYTGKVGELSGGIGALYQGMQPFGDKLSMLPAAMESLGNAVHSMSGGAQQFQQGASAVKESAAGLKGQLDGLNQGISSAESLVNLALEAINSADIPENEEAAQKLLQARAGLEAIAGQLGGSSIDTSAIGALEAGAAQAEAGAGVLQENLQTMSGTLNSMGDLQTVLNTMLDSVGQLKNGAEMLCGYSQPLNDAADALHTGASQLDSGMGSLVSGTSALRTGADALGDGIEQLSAGASELKDGTGKLKEGGRELKSGTAKLETGAAELADGMQKFDEEGVSKLTKLVEEELNDFLDRLDAVVDADQQYTAFDGAGKDTKGNVKFVIRTKEIKAGS